MNVLFTVRCPTCNATLRVRHESAIGQILNCPKCESMVQITPPAGWQPPEAVAAGAFSGGAAMAAAETHLTGAKAGHGRRDVPSEAGSGLSHGGEAAENLTAASAATGSAVGVAEFPAISTAASSRVGHASGGRVVTEAAAPDVAATSGSATGGLGMRPWYGGLAVLTVVAGGWIIKDWSSRSARDLADGQQTVVTAASAGQGFTADVPQDRVDPIEGADANPGPNASEAEPDTDARHSAAPGSDTTGSNVPPDGAPVDDGSKALREESPASEPTAAVTAPPEIEAEVGAAGLPESAGSATRLADSAGDEVVAQDMVRGSANETDKSLQAETEVDDRPPEDTAEVEATADPPVDTPTGADSGDEARPSAAAEAGPEMTLADTDPVVVEIKKQLAQPLAEIEVEAMPLAEVLTFLEDLTGLRIRLEAHDGSSKSLEAATVTLKLADTDVAEVLTQALSQNGLTYRIEDAGLTVQLDAQ